MSGEELRRDWPDVDGGRGGIAVSIEREDGQPPYVAVDTTRDAEWTFAFLTAEEAREVAAHLIACANAVEGTPDE